VHSAKERINLTLVKTKTLLRIIVIRGDIGVNFKYNQDKWGFIGKEQRKRISEKLPRRDMRVGEFLLYWLSL
jgi:hypothetical protein